MTLKSSNMEICESTIPSTSARNSLQNVSVNPLGIVPSPRPTQGPSASFLTRGLPVKPRRIRTNKYTIFNFSFIFFMIYFYFFSIFLFYCFFNNNNTNNNNNNNFDRWVNGNQLSGTLPTEIGNLISLTEL